MTSELIILVDDDHGFRKGMERVLKSHGFTVRSFASAEEFQASSFADEASCFVLDINLTGLSGIALRHILKSQGFSTPVVFITADDNEATRMAAHTAGCLAFLEKPFPARRLVEVIRADA